jgi:hypothetical protein
MMVRPKNAAAVAASPVLQAIRRATAAAPLESVIMNSKG